MKHNHQSIMLISLGLTIFWISVTLCIVKKYEIYLMSFFLGIRARYFLIGVFLGIAIMLWGFILWMIEGYKKEER